VPSLIILLAAPLFAAFDITVTDTEWRDEKRQRQVPLRLYEPAAPAPMPVIIFSPGLGGNKASYPHLAHQWAGRGYFCVFLQHLGSDSAALIEKGWMFDDIMECMEKAIKDPANYVNRPRDVSFAIDQLERANREGPLAGKLDLKHIGLAGHSFGAYTVLAVAGHRFTRADGQQIDFADRRITAAIALSERPPYTQDPQTELGGIRIPMLHMQGSHDVSPFGDVVAADRRKIFDQVPPRADHYLIILSNGIHKTFAQEVLPGQPVQEDDRGRFAIILASTTKFWDAYLRTDPAALQNLRQHGFRPLVRIEDTAEKKLAEVPGNAPQPATQPR
jgi:predicted dienelactone hydrolase